MQYLASKNYWEAGSNRPLPIPKFGDLAFVEAETSAEAVAEYAALRKHDLHKPSEAFAQAFGPYLLEPHDVNDFAAAAQCYEIGLIIQKATEADDTLIDQYLAERANLADSQPYKDLTAHGVKVNPSADAFSEVFGAIADRELAAAILNATLDL